LPTLVNIAGGPKGDGLKKQIEAGQYPGIVGQMSVVGTKRRFVVTHQFGRYRM
jgi:hypothetical protein